MFMILYIKVGLEKLERVGFERWKKEHPNFLISEGAIIVSKDNIFLHGL